MGNVYRAQNVATYLIYELNEMQTFINHKGIQCLLAEIDSTWQKVFGHSIFHEATCHLSKGYFIKEIVDTYSEFGDEHIHLPAMEWYLPFGSFQLIQRTYSVPAFTEFEKRIIEAILNRYKCQLLKKAS